MDTTQGFLAKFPELDRDRLEAYLTFLAGCSTPEAGAYGEAHHVFPKSLFPEFRLKRQHPWNQRRLTAKDHFIAHYYLHLLFKDVCPQMSAAWYVLWANKYQKLTPELLVTYAEEYQAAKEIHRERMRALRPSAETRAKMSASAKVKVFTETHKANMSQGKRGHVHSEETKKKIGDKQRGVPRGPRDPAVVEASASKLRGRKRKPEHVAAARAGRTPHPHSDVTRQKMREASARRWARPGERERASKSALARRPKAPLQLPEDEG